MRTSGATVTALLVACSWANAAERVFFVSNRSGAKFQVHSIEADGSDPRGHAEAGAVGFDPCLSPDRSRVAMVLTKTGEDKESSWVLAVTDATGMNQKELIRSHTTLLSPAWSKDGNKIAFTSFKADRLNLDEPDTRVDVLTLDGGRRSRVVDGYAPCWSPDGKRIIFHRSASGGSPVLLAIDLKTNEESEFISGSAATASWSPDGKKIAFVATGKENRFDVFLTDGPGGKRRQLTNTADVEFGTQWSKDGRRVYFARAKKADINKKGEPRACHLFSVDSESGEERQLTKGESVNMLGIGGALAMKFHLDATSKESREP